MVEAKRSGAEQPIPSVESEEVPQTHTNGYHKSPKPSVLTSPSPASSPAKREASSADALSDVVDHGPPKKKRKSSMEDDATLAARLQAEEDKRARPTRGGPSRKAAPSKKKKTPKKKSSAKVNSDGSEIDDEDKPKKTTGFHVCDRETSLCATDSSTRNRSICLYPSPNFSETLRYVRAALWLSPVADLVLYSCHGPKLRNDSGSTSKATTYKIRLISDTFDATNRCEAYLSKIVCTCSP